MIIKWLKENWILVAILLLGAFLRLYKISDYMTFLGDEGRDVILVRNLLVNADPILIGPGTSVGNMYLGPFYYYFMAPFLFLSNFSPVGPAIGVALLGVATIYLVYVVGREWFSKTAGLISAFLFAISPTVITFSHSSWNPNIMPFFALLSVYSIWKVWKGSQYKQSLASSTGKWLFVTAVSFACVLQSHYLGVLIAPVLIIYWLLSHVPKRYTLISILLFSFLMSPLLAFDIRHNFINSKALIKYVTTKQDKNVSLKSSPVSKVYLTFKQINSSLLVVKKENVGSLITILFTLYLVFLIFKRNDQKYSNYNILILWLISGLLGFLIYKQNIIDHYFGFLFPVPFLLFGALFNQVQNSKSMTLKFGVLILTSYLVFINLANNPFTKFPNYQMRRAQEVSKKVLEITAGKPFNLAVLADRNYEDGYRYFMEVAGAKVLHADRWDQKTIVDSLIVICEKPENECDPTHSPKAEVANFGWSKIEDKWIVDGVIIYKLGHSK